MENKSESVCNLERNLSIKNRFINALTVLLMAIAGFVLKFKARYFFLLFVK